MQRAHPRFNTQHLTYFWEDLHYRVPETGDDDPLPHLGGDVHSDHFYHALPEKEHKLFMCAFIYYLCTMIYIHVVNHELIDREPSI
jgi:hypothetical protein